jgi:hypothetical protein
MKGGSAQQSPRRRDVHPNRRDKGFRQLNREAVGGVQDTSAGAILIKKETKIPERWDDIKNDVTRLPCGVGDNVRDLECGCRGQEC